MSYRFDACPELLRTTLIELARSQPEPWFGDLHLALVRKEEWKPRIFQSAESCRHALNTVLAWAIGAAATAKASEEIPGDTTLAQAVMFLANVAADLRLQLLDLEPQDASAN